MKMGTVVFVCDGTLVDIDEREFARASSASSLISLLEGKTIEDAKKITESRVFNELGGLPDLKIDCIVLERGTGD